MARYSEKCKDLTTRWDGKRLICVRCTFTPGREVTPNCGFDDRGGRHVLSSTPCKPGMFNDGSGPHCQSCTLCPQGFDTISPCNFTTNTQCQDLRKRMVTGSLRPQEGSALSPTALYPHTWSHAQWAVPVALLMTAVLIVSCVVYMKRKRGQSSVPGSNRRSSYINTGFTPLSAPPNNELDILSPEILSAPLQTVLDNVDVLEELVILLDPESHGVKNTKHLASHCSFPSTWITYAFSMKDTKSPLKAVLEGVTTRNPDWTVGNLAKILQHMGRNDAIAVLSQLRLRG